MERGIVGAPVHRWWDIAKILNEWSASRTSAYNFITFSYECQRFVFETKNSSDCDAMDECRNGVPSSYLVKKPTFGNNSTPKPVCVSLPRFSLMGKIMPSIKLELSGQGQGDLVDLLFTRKTCGQKNFFGTTTAELDSSFSLWEKRKNHCLAQCPFV